MDKFIVYIACAVALGFGVSGCGGGGSSSNGGGIDEAVGNAPPPMGMLRPAVSAQDLVASLGLGLSGQAFNPDQPVLEEGALGGELAASPAPVAADDFSSTTLQEAGVDEADNVKYDGEVLYMLVEAGYTGATDPLVSLHRTDIDAPATESVSQIVLQDYGYGAGLYLFEQPGDKQLVTVGQSGGPWGWELFIYDGYWDDSRTLVQAWSVDEPEIPELAWSISIDGALLTSRRVDDVLYLVTRYSPAVDGLIDYPETQEDIDANQQLIESTPLSNLLPKIARDGGAPEELLASGDCLVPNEEYDGALLPPASGSLITVTAVDLGAPDRMASLCINSFASGFYASRGSLYLTAGGAERYTLIHKVGFHDGVPEYRGSGEVRGYLGLHNPSFMMSEREDYLRVVSSEWDAPRLELPILAVGDTSADATDDAEQPDLGRHFVTVFQESQDGTRLEQVAQIPNAASPRRIGKPGEDLYAARFAGDRAYLVTFEVIDPLYVVDLSDDGEPYLAGELEIPGFSTVLQPIGENLLLGVGTDVPESGPGLAGGVKLSLFDVGDIANPIEMGSEIIGKRGSYSPAQYDHHALTLLAGERGYRVALPVQRAEHLGEGEDPGDPWAWYQWSDVGLHQFEIDTAAGSLEPVGVLVSEQRTTEQLWPLLDVGSSRSVIHDDAVFFVQPPEIFPGVWGSAAAD